LKFKRLLETKLWRRTKTGSLYRPLVVGWGCAGDAGAPHAEPVEGGFGRFFALLQSFGRSFHARRRIVSYSEENRTKTFT
jgi:hypothetical protein